MTWITISYTYLPSVYLLWWNGCQGLWLIFEMGLFVFLLLSFKSSLHIFMQTVFICYAFCKCFLPDCGLSSDSLDIACHTADVFNFDSVTNPHEPGTEVWCHFQMETSFSLRVPREERPALLWPTSDLQNCRLTNGYCLSHSLLYFATWLQKAERMETGADEGARAGDHICLLVASPYQPRAWPKHSLPSGRLGDPRHLCSAPRSPPESLPASLKQEILLREKSEQEECLVFPSSHFARGDFKQSLMLWSERRRSHSPLEAQLCHLPAL